ncbi:single-stranded DNA-binding protein [Staphylococcus pettenkoferi]|uniref:Single-stranded DNA-binding protein n=1 Tax=Staphylococcus pettenkoferi TaxID=170573 RepID=A0ABT4BL54_9STAP|nr:single-stranded DNA-binding protein [Staphylococcus pettenkoferi]MCY1583318.1 single-stranded DNA-binding protein [Staphylococcus pettenkoferi]
MNFSVYTGRIATDLEVKQTQAGKNVLPFTIAVQRDYKNKSTNKYDTDFFRCLATGGAADFLANYGGKGYMVGLQGKMQNNNYERQDGTQVESSQLIVSNVDAGILFLNKNENNNQQSYSQNANNQPQQQRGQAKPQNNWQQQQQQNNQQAPNQQNNPFANANGAVDISEEDLPFD